jgi:hypothetical protein
MSRDRMGEVNFMPEPQAIIFVALGGTREAKFISYSDLVCRLEHFSILTCLGKY